MHATNHLIVRRTRRRVVAIALASLALSATPISHAAGAGDGKSSAAKKPIHYHHVAAALDQYEILDTPGVTTLKQLNDAIQKHPDSPMAYVHRGSSYWREGDLSNAASDFQTALRLDPKCADAHIGMNRVYQTETKFPAAFEELRKAAVDGSLKTAVNALWESAFLHKELKHFKVADEQFTQVIKSNLLSKEHLAFALVQRAVNTSDGGDGKRALKDLEQALTLDPGLEDAHVVRAHISKNLGLYQDALAEYSLAIKLESEGLGVTRSGWNSNLPSLYRNRAFVYDRLGQGALAQSDRKSASNSDTDVLRSMPMRTDFK